MGRSSQLDRAARELAPAVVDAGGQQARLETYVAAIRGRGRSRALVLAPIATEGLPKEIEWAKVVVLAADGFILHATRIEVGRGEVSVPLHGARLTPAPPTRRLTVRRAPRDPRILVVPYGGDEVDLYAFPVLDLSRDGCAIEASHPLVAGAQLQGVELWGDRRLLRRAMATVLETIPWRTPDGDRRFRMRLSLAEMPDSSPRASDRVTDPTRVRRILELAALVSTRVSLELVGGARLSGHLISAESDKLSVRVDEPTLAAARLQLDFELFGVSYAMDVRVVRWSSEQRLVTLAFPLHLHRRQRRYQFRASVPEEIALTLVTHNPATGEVITRSLLDLSFGGASFAVDPEKDVLWPGLALEAGKILWAERAVAVGELEVRSVDEQRICRVEMRAPTTVDSPAFVDLMARLRYPTMEVHDGADFDGMVKLYEEVGLFGAHMTRNLPPVRDAARVTWKRMHASDLCRTLVQREEGRLVAAVSAVRAWDQSWVIQHMVASPDRRIRKPSVLHMAYLDHILPRPDGRYMVVFVNTANRRITSFLERFFALTGTPEAIARRDMSLWVVRGGRKRSGILPTIGLSIRSMRQADERAVGNAAERMFGRLGAAALALREGDFAIEDTRAQLRRLGVHRQRRSSLITDRGYPILALIEEQSDPGLNLTWLLNATWVLPMHPERRGADALHLAAAHILGQPAQTATGDRFALLPAEIETTAFERAGFEHEAEVSVHSYNRAGLHRWYYFIRERRDPSGSSAEPSTLIAHAG